MSDKRRTRRSPLHTQGFILRNGRHITFRTRDLSLGGCRVELPAVQAPVVGKECKIFLSGPGFGADARVRWIEKVDAGTILLGLQFLKLNFSEPRRDAATG